MKSNRINWLDTSKGVTILLMILGHSSIPIFLSNFIWLFHMPLFFIASGWTTNWQKTDIKSFINKKCRTLLLPFFIYSFFVLTIYIYQGWGNFTNMILNGWEAYALWFIPVLLLSSILAKLIYSVKQKYLPYVFLLMFLVIGGVLSFYKIFLPWNLSSVPFATFLIVTGNELKRFSSKISDSKIWHILLLFFITAAISQFWRLDLCFNSILPVIPLTMGALTGTMMIFMISYLIDKYFYHISIVLQKVGKETYLILAFSQIIIMLINDYFSLNTMLKYSSLFLCLILLKYIKDVINKITKSNIL